MLHKVGKPDSEAVYFEAVVLVLEWAHRHDQAEYCHQCSNLNKVFLDVTTHKFHIT